MNIDLVKERYILSMLDNQIDEGNEILELAENDYIFLVNQLKNHNMLIYNLSEYKGYRIKVYHRSSSYKLQGKEFEMNLLEHYLVETIKIEPFTDEDWSNEDWAKGKEFIWVTATFNCYGRKETTRSIYSKDEWQGIVDRGYYMG